MTEPPATQESLDVDPDESPWPVPPISGIPFADDSEEARAIERIIRWSEGGTDEQVPASDSQGEATSS